MKEPDIEGNGVIIGRANVPLAGYAGREANIHTLPVGDAVTE